MDFERYFQKRGNEDSVSEWYGCPLFCVDLQDIENFCNVFAMFRNVLVMLMQCSVCLPLLLLHLLLYSFLNLFPQNPYSRSTDGGTVSFDVIGNNPKGFLRIVGNLEEVVIIGFV